MAFVDTRKLERQHQPQRPQSTSPRRRVDALRQFTLFVKTCIEVAKQRHALRKLDEKMLSDIGISRSDAYREYSRPFWDLPSDLHECRSTRSSNWTQKNRRDVKPGGS